MELEVGGRAQVIIAQRLAPIINGELVPGVDIKNRSKPQRKSLQHGIWGSRVIYIAVFRSERPNKQGLCVERIPLHKEIGTECSEW